VFLQAKKDFNDYQKHAPLFINSSSKATPGQDQPPLTSTLNHHHFIQQ
jgi:hypothetical protein